MEFLNGASRFCTRVARFFLVVAGAAISVIIFFQLVFRFFIKIPLPWSEELSRYLMIWIGMLGASIVTSSPETAAHNSSKPNSLLPG